jgi:hypothetical protein
MVGGVGMSWLSACARILPVVARPRRGLKKSHSRHDSHLRRQPPPTTTLASFVTPQTEINAAVDRTPAATVVLESPKEPPRMSDERDSGSHEYLDDEPTHVVARPGPPLGLEHAGLAPLYARLVEALQLSASAVELLVGEVLIGAGATTTRLSAEQLWAMRSGLFEIVDGVLPSAISEIARTNLLTLLLSVAPLPPARRG